MSGVVHHLKSWPTPFTALWRGAKTFEVRRDDRGYREGDVLVLQEWDPQTREHTGRQVLARVTYCWSDWHLVGLGGGGVVVMGIHQLDKAHPAGDGTPIRSFRRPPELCV